MCFEILSLEIKPNPFNTHCSLNLSFTRRIRRVNTMLLVGKIDDIITSFIPRSIQGLPMLITSCVKFSVFILSFVWLFISLGLIYNKTIRGGSKTAAASKMKLFVIIVNGFQAFTINTKCSILDVAAVLDPSLTISGRFSRSVGRI